MNVTSPVGESASAYRRTAALRTAILPTAVLRTAAAACMAMLGAVVCGCGSSSQPQTTATVSQVTEAAYRSTQSPGYRFSLDMTVNFGGHAMTIGGEGAMSSTGKRGFMTMDLEGTQLEEIVQAPYVYVRNPGGSSASGKPWLRTDLNLYSQVLGAQGAPQTDPAHMLALLKASGAVESLGSTMVRGEPSRHYRASVNLTRYLQNLRPSERATAQPYIAALRRMTGSGTLPIDVFVDAAGRVSRLGFTMHVCTPEGTVSDAISMDLYDYGRPSFVAAPSASEATDVTAKLRSELSRTMQQLHC